jgi:DNA-directed RNA polymerase specialized sigma subunit, sigma24 homolog
MQYWKKNRNYRKYRNADGSFRCVITVDGQDIEVSKVVYEAYAQADRRERYCYEREEGLLLSLERMDEEGMHPTFPTDRRTEAAEDTAMRRILTAEALEALSQLKPDEQHLIRAVVMEGMPERVYAAQIGITENGVNKRKLRALKKLSRKFAKFLY